ncbi:MULTISPECIES: hypothetical protein [Methanosarcina]|uniref:Orotate phosphoribosyltransferase n=1 Tax=Methanosarcina mazei Tuc01 TaxID=1236903 RepID=M1QFC8_METMZ|nr:MULTISPECIES: hypothetical protein [Methanosarcina]AGF95714.1 hypothetical protein MmTuc01_0265 [Methanosarcina mazei Tuc01]WIM43533.1 hypothetical protein PSF70_01490 [Methanosarcina mazei]WIM46985.1 hypothetical protein PQQ20_01485 [Methanosarcina mazei]
MCSICGRPAKLHTCHLCGRPVCSQCMDHKKGVCIKCAGGREGSSPVSEDREFK